MSEQLVWHYTSMSTLVAILDSRQLWLWDSRTVADTHETRWAERFCSRLGLNDIVALARAVHAFRGESVAFLGCFSKVSDDPFMWANYADQGRGVALGMSRSALEENATTKNQRVHRVKEGGFASVEDVVYGPSEAVSALQQLNEEAGYVGVERASRLLGSAHEWWEEDDACSALDHVDGIIGRFEAIACAMKHRRYRDEHETRFIQIEPRASHRIRESADGRLHIAMPLVDFVATPERSLPSGCRHTLDGTLKKVWLGPHAEDMSEHTQSKLRALSTASVQRSGST